MRNRLLIFLIALAGGLLGANVQPILTGAGKLIFPEHSPGASISASGGAMTLQNTGTNQSLFLNPSGTGNVSVNFASPWSLSKVWVHASTDANIALSDGTFGGGLGSGVALHALNDAINANVPLDLRGSTVRITGNTLFSNLAGTAAYPVDAVGDINASGVFRQGGTAGLSITKTVRNSAGTGTCNLVFNGGILTASTC